MISLNINTATTLCYLSFWLCFYYNGIIDKVLLSWLDLPIWLPLQLIFLALLILTNKNALRLDRTILVYFFLFLTSLLSFQNFYNLYSFSVLSILLSILLAAHLNQKWTIPLKIQQTIFDLGSITSLLSILMFIYFLGFDKPVLGIDPVRPGWGYAIDRGVILRLVGFSDDPNFFAICTLLPILIGLKNPSLTRRRFGIALMALALILTVSRSGAICTATALVLYYLSNKKLPITTIILIAIFIAIAFGTYILFSDYFLTADNISSNRGFTKGLDSRLNLVSLLMTHNELSLTGNGWGISKEIIGIHSHNTFFDYLYEGGIIAFGVYLTICGIFFMNFLSSPSTMKIYALVVLVGSLAVSIAFQPIVLLSLLLGRKHAD